MTAKYDGLVLYLKAIDGIFVKAITTLSDCQLYAIFRQLTESDVEVVESSGRVFMATGVGKVANMVVVWLENPLL